MYSCHLFLTSSSSVWPCHFCPLLCPTIYLHHSLNKTILSLLAALWNSAFSWISFFFSFAFHFSSFPSYLQDHLRKLLCLLAFPFLWDGLLLLPVHYESLPIVLQALCVPDITLCHLHYRIISHLIYGISEWPSGFLHFLQSKPEFCREELVIWATIYPRCFLFICLFLLTV